MKINTNINGRTLYKVISAVYKVDFQIEIVDGYVNYISTVILNHGKKYAVDHLKSLHHIATQIAMGSRPLLVIPFLGTTREGSPYLFERIGLGRLLRGSKTEASIALTITSFYKDIILEADQDIDSITSPGPDLSIPDDWSTFLFKWTKKFKSKGLKWSGMIHETTKNGPNGPALVNSHIDLFTVGNDPKLFNNILDWCRVTSNPHLLKYITDSFDRIKGLALTVGLHSKLAFLQEGGGKTRVIAMADYYTQEILTPLHREVMNFLRSLSTDGTYDQSHIVSKTIQAMKDRKPIYCFDLKSATDRLPAPLQVDVLSHIYGEGISTQWLKLMTDRVFQVGKGKEASYAVGQPMGILSSWAVFSLTHHAIVEYCAFKIGIKSFRDYVILGDDVAIFHSDVAKLYKSFMMSMGVEISPHKSYVWEPGMMTPPFAEIAKRLIVDGEEITPIPYTALKLFSRQPHKEVISFRIAVERSGKLLGLENICKLADSLKLSKARKDQLLVLGTAPMRLLSDTKSSQAPHGVMEGPWADFDLRQVYQELQSILIEKLTKKQETIMNVHEIVMSNNYWNEHYKMVGESLQIEILGLGSLNIAEMHPLVWVINNRLEGLWAIDSLLSELENPESIMHISWDDLVKADFTLATTFSSKRARLGNHQTNVLMQLWKRLKESNS
jgi:hypothetical protein